VLLVSDSGWVSPRHPRVPQAANPLSLAKRFRGSSPPYLLLIPLPTLVTQTTRRRSYEHGRIKLMADLRALPIPNRLRVILSAIERGLDPVMLPPGITHGFNLPLLKSLPQSVRDALIDTHRS
jgi:hypothetical protein